VHFAENYFVKVLIPLKGVLNRVLWFIQVRVSVLCPREKFQAL